MMAKVIRFLHHQLRAQSRYDVHSPFVFEFVTQVLPHRKSDILDRVEALRRACLSDNAIIQIEDHGAGYGGVANPNISKKLPEVVRSSARAPREGALLHRLCAHYRPAQLLELGTNLGFSTLYQALAVPQSQFITIEGAPALAEYARRHFTRFQVNPDVRVGEFSSVLQGIDWMAFKPSYVLLDGNHRYSPTMEYFQFLLPKLRDGALLVIDDIHWSSEMQAAWKSISAHPEVTLSIDLFHLGLCWVRRPQAKEHFRFRFWV